MFLCELPTYCIDNSAEFSSKLTRCSHYEREKNIPENHPQKDREAAGTHKSTRSLLKSLVCEVRTCLNNTHLTSVF